ncbi:MAG: multiheme c-type cytochrome [Ignavibacteriota bacterium]
MLHSETGSAVCANCHREIFDAYRKTGMARSSGPVAGIETEGAFAPQTSGARYRIYRQAGAAWMRFDVAEVRGPAPAGILRRVGIGRPELSFFDRWFSVPGAGILVLVNGEVGSFAGYRQYDQLYLTRPTDTVCLQCHASRLQPVAGTVNGFRKPPFQEGGVSCERCHGPGDAHVAGRER